MNSSPSHSSLNSLVANDLDGKAVEKQAEGHAPHRARSLLDLPDELLSAVFDQVYHTVRAEKTEEKDGIPVSTSQILVNKRIYHLARPLWFHHLSSTEYCALDRHLAHLDFHRDTGLYVESLAVGLPWVSTSFFILLLSFLPNLRRLVIRDTRAEHSDNPRSFSSTALSALKTLKSLQHLSIHSVDDLFCGHDVNFGADFPALHSLEVAHNNHLCTIARLHDLTLFSGLLPSRAPLPLAHLHFNFPCLDHCDPEDGIFSQEHFWGILASVDHSKLEHLEISHFPAHLGLSDNDFTVDTVRSITLRGPNKLWSSNNLHALSLFLATFPNLHTLRLEHFQFSNILSPGPAVYAQRGLVDLATLLPILCALVTHLQSTTVTELQCLDAEGSQEVRWTRPSPDENFKSQLWHLW
ncbi:hypothetical protein JCM8097_007550 [Rhodosporidiobolus ruineniae]